MLSGTSNLEWHCRDFEISKFENLSQDQSCSRCSVYHRNCFSPLGFLVWHREQRSSVGRFPLCKTTHTTTFGGVRYILTYMMGIRTIPSQACEIWSASFYTRIQLGMPAVFLFCGTDHCKSTYDELLHKLLYVLSYTKWKWPTSSSAPSGCGDNVERLTSLFNWVKERNEYLEWRHLRLRQNEGTLWRQHRVLRCCPSVAKRGNIVARCADTRNVSEDFQKQFFLCPPQILHAWQRERHLENKVTPPMLPPQCIPRLPAPNVYSECVSDGWIVFRKIGPTVLLQASKRTFRAFNPFIPKFEKCILLTF